MVFAIARIFLFIAVADVVQTYAVLAFWEFDNFLAGAKFLMPNFCYQWCPSTWMCVRINKVRELTAGEIMLWISLQGAWSDHVHHDWVMFIKADMKPLLDLDVEASYD